MKGFLFRNNTLTDTQIWYRRNLNGYIGHNNFSDWKLDLDIKFKRLVALDTKDSEDAAITGSLLMVAQLRTYQWFIYKS
jgi:hypothetical protein